MMTAPPKPYTVTRNFEVPETVETREQYRGSGVPKRVREIQRSTPVGCGHDKFKDMEITGYKAGPNPMQEMAARDVLIDMLNRGKFTHLRVVWGGQVTEWVIKDIPKSDVPAPCGHPDHWLLRFVK